MNNHESNQPQEAWVQAIGAIDHPPLLEDKLHQVPARSRQRPQRLRPPQWIVVGLTVCSLLISGWLAIRWLVAEPVGGERVTDRRALPNHPRGDDEIDSVGAADVDSPRRVGSGDNRVDGSHENQATVDVTREIPFDLRLQREILARLTQEEAARSRVAAPRSRVRHGDATIAAQFMRTPAILLLSSDYQLRDGRGQEEARRGYHSVVTHFPDTSWAQTARERLARLD